jgi:Resolvase, N terminal domain
MVTSLRRNHCCRGGGLLFVVGAAALWRVRLAPAATFNHAKGYAIAGAALAFLIWFFATRAARQLWPMRTSSAANVGTDKDSEKRQRHAIQGFAKRAGFAIVEEFYDAAVSGADPIETRAGFASLLDRIEGNGVRTVIVEDASRFARELMAQELGITLLISRGVRLLTASGDDLTASDDPTRR